MTDNRLFLIAVKPFIMLILLIFLGCEDFNGLVRVFRGNYAAQPVEALNNDKI